MGCRLVRGETVYFVSRGGPDEGGLEADWFGTEKDARLLPRVYTDGNDSSSLNSVIPIEVQCFEFS